jgi:hypothetical protein
MNLFDNPESDNSDEKKNSPRCRGLLVKRPEVYQLSIIASGSWFS